MRITENNPSTRTSASTAPEASSTAEVGTVSTAAPSLSDIVDTYERGSDGGMYHTLPYVPGRDAPRRSPDVDTTYCVHLSDEDLLQLAQALASFEDGYRGWRCQHPEAHEPSDGSRTVGELLDDPSLSDHELCARLVAVLLHEEPGLAGELQAAAGAPGASPSVPSVPAAPAASADPMAGILGMAGMGANLLGGLLQNPLAIPILSGVCLAIPGLEPLALAVPLVAPVAGMVLSGVGGMATQAAQGQGAAVGGGAVAAGAADPLMGLLGGLTGAPATAPNAPVLPLPAR